MKYLIPSILLIAACTEEHQMKSKAAHISKYENCEMSGPAIVYGVKLYGAQDYMGVNNFRLRKNKVEIKNMLPSLAPQFQGIDIGMDILTNGGLKKDLIIDFEKEYQDKFPIVLEDKTEKLELGFYDQEKGKDLHFYCEFYWDDNKEATKIMDLQKTDTKKFKVIRK